MGPQGNILKEESLVLVVTIEAPRPDHHLGWWKDQILANIARHMQWRFNKGRYGGTPTVDLLDLDAARRRLDAAQVKSDQLQKLVQECVKVELIGAEPPRLLPAIAVDLVEKVQLRDHECVLVVLRMNPRSPETANEEHAFVCAIQNAAAPRPCAVEFFRVEPEQGATQDVSDDLYHLASRVCGAFTEYRINYASKIAEEATDPEAIQLLQGVQQQFFFPKQAAKSDESVGECGAEARTQEACPSICAVDVSLPKPLNKPKHTVIPKILDIRDAVSIVCEGLDGSQRFFPPIPRGIHDIFAGKDNHTRVVAARYKFPFGIWFRGQSRVCFDVVPSLFQESHWKEVHSDCKKQVCQKTMYDEASMVHHFMSQKPLLRHDYVDHFEWLALMQHYGAPTRVLDWTENILIALYFAVWDTTADCDSVVWALNAGRLNEITRVSASRRYACLATSTDVVVRSAMAISRTGSELRRTLRNIGKLAQVEEAIKDDYFWQWTKGEHTRHKSPTWHKLAAPVAVFPTRVNEREEDQLATFTVYGGKQYDAEVTSIEEWERFPPPMDLVELSRWRVDIPEEDPSKPPAGDDGKRRVWDPDSGVWLPKGKPFLKAFLVPSCAKRKLREQLKRLGVHVGALFPELEQQTKYIRHQWRFEYEHP